MNKLLKISGIIVSIFLVVLFTGILIYNWNYYREKDSIKKELDQLEGISVLDIWGHKDLSLEHVSALLKIENKGQIILTNLNKDDYGYPQRISIPYIGGFSFKTFKCSDGLGIGSSIEIGENDILGNIIGLRFDSHLDVIKQYDTILSFVESLPTYPDLGHYHGERGEELFIMTIPDNDPNTEDILLNLIGIEDYFEYAKTLEWENKNCIE